jgi:uncharacterized protein (TIGR03382 family)
MRTTGVWVALGVAGLAANASGQIQKSAMVSGPNSGGSFSAVLWDQSNYDTAASAFVDQQFGDFPTFSSYLVTDVVVGNGGWNIDSITTYYTIGATGVDLWPAAGTAMLNVFAKAGALPGAGDDPGLGTVVATTFVDADAGTQAMTASGLGLVLGPGEYWIGLTPILDFLVFSQEFHRGAPIIGGDTAFRNPGGGFGIGSGWSTTAILGGNWIGAYDAAILIQGEVIPAPGAVALLGLGGLACLRRRR